MYVNNGMWYVVSSKYFTTASNRLKFRLGIGVMGISYNIICRETVDERRRRRRIYIFGAPGVSVFIAE